LKKGLVSYFKNNGIIILKIVDANHGEIAKTIEEKVNSTLKSPLERILANKRLTMNASAILYFFARAIDPYIKIMHTKKTFVENLGLLLIKNHLPTQFVESIWLNHLVIQLCFHILLPTKGKPSIRKCY
jgi:hypothetical protein